MNFIQYSDQFLKPRVPSLYKGCGQTLTRQQSHAIDHVKQLCVLSVWVLYNGSDSYGRVQHVHILGITSLGLFRATFLFLRLHLLCSPCKGRVQAPGCRTPQVWPPPRGDACYPSIGIMSTWLFLCQSTTPLQVWIWKAGQQKHAHSYLLPFELAFVYAHTGLVFQFNVRVRPLPLHK